MGNLRILFTHSYFLAFDPKQLQWNKPYPPLMTIQAAAMVREAGHKVYLHDVMFEEKASSIKIAIENFQPEIVVLFDDGFNYLTKMCLTNMREAAWEMVKISKQADCKVIVCSSDATDHYTDYLDKGVDFVLLGEGESSLLELIDSLVHQHDPKDTLGIAFKNDGEIINTGRRAVMQVLDELPAPAWDLINFEEYKIRWEPNWGHFSLNIATTRGCPYKCNWCAKPIYGNSYKMRSPEHVIREIAYLMNQTDFDHIWFCDDIFGLKRSWVIEFSKLVQEKGLQFKYKIQSRADLLVKDQYIEALASSGCDEIWMGVESGSQKILDAMDKGITLEQVHSATAKLKKYGIKPCFFIQFGYLDESAEDIKDTIDLICKLLPHDIGISVSYPLPGTGFFEKVKKDLQEKANWTDSNDLDLMFKNTYTPEFYKALHHFVHQKFRQHRALAQWNSLPFSTSLGDWKRALSWFYYTPKTYLAKRQLKVIDYEAAASL